VRVFVISLHVLICLSIIGVVLLQQGKGADIGAAFGAGASNTVFGGRGAGSFLAKLTTGFAIAFMVTSLGLAYVAVPRSIESVVGGASELEAPEAAEPVAPEPTRPIEDSTGEAPSGFEAIESPVAPTEGAPAKAEGAPAESDPAQETAPD
jgi:preprotein translocase subunit SecG